jgi:uncharacterized membrane protein YqaE (UPF0057 family)
MNGTVLRSYPIAVFVTKGIVHSVIVNSVLVINKFL